VLCDFSDLRRRSALRPHADLQLENMFLGKPHGNYDRLLDFSRAVSGCLFFVPSASFLDDGQP
jgi:deferrochelatase/peroxidase EfeB